MARSRRSGGNRGSTANGTKRRERDPAPQSSNDSDSEDGEDTTQDKRSSPGRGPVASSQMMPEVATRTMTDSAGGDDGVSSMQGSMTNPIDLETWRRMEERLQHGGWRGERCK
jgi:hypothetical protein